MMRGVHVPVLEGLPGEAGEWRREREKGERERKKRNVLMRPCRELPINTTEQGASEGGLQGVGKGFVSPVLGGGEEEGGGRKGEREGKEGRHGLARD